MIFFAIDQTGMTMSVGIQFKRISWWFEDPDHSCESQGGMLHRKGTCKYFNHMSPI